MTASGMRETAWLATVALLVAAGGGGVFVGAQCDFTQQVPVGVYYDIASPNYPAAYPAGANCRWRATSAAGSRLQLKCNIELPQTTNCQQDRLLVSPSGDDTLSDAHVYCGRGTFTIQSDSTKLTMVLQASYYSQGGRFLCNITAVPSTSCSCGIKKESRIVGGVETGINEYPFMCALIDSQIKEVYCGCTIVSEHYVLTAAHCTLNKNVSIVGVLVGDHDLTTGAETSASKLYRVQSFIPHPNYNNGGTVEQDNDIALIRIVGVIAMSREVMPACLPIRYANYDFTNNQVVVTGWGTLSFGGQMSNTLQKADLYIQSPAQCSSVFGITVSYRQMCSYNAGKDACQADSGGPVYWRDPSTGLVHIIGVVSHGVACATTVPGVNTRVTSFLSWITSIIGAEDQYCVN